MGCCSVVIGGNKKKFSWRCQQKTVERSEIKNWDMCITRDLGRLKFLYFFWLEKFFLFLSFLSDRLTRIYGNTQPRTLSVTCTLTALPEHHLASHTRNTSNMSAPTAKLSTIPTAQAVPQHIEEEEEVLINPSGAAPVDEAMDTTEEAAAPVPASGSLTLDQDGKPRFASVAESGKAVRFAQRNIPIPPHRFTPLKASWAKIYQPLVEHLHLQVRMDVRNKKIQIRTCKLTTDPGAIQKGDDFIRAFNLGFDIDDAIALLRLNDCWWRPLKLRMLAHR